MELASTIALLALAAAPLAILGGWLASRNQSVAAPLGSGSDGWWRQAMPWPHGVQEDDEVHWDFGAEGAARSEARGADEMTTAVATVRLRASVRRIGSR
jgi:hypothetical protein